MTLASFAMAQVPDLLNALDAGARSVGLGGSLSVAGSDTLSSFYNPAGLAYLDGRRFGVTYRNLPSSESTLSGQFSDPRFESRGGRGSQSISHLGYTTPFKGSGVLGVSYVTGGYINDVRTGSMTSGALTVRNYAESIEARSDFFTVAYGKANASQSLSYGVGLVFAQQSLDYSQSYGLFSGNAQVSTTTVGPLSTQGTGVGILVGAQLIPAKIPNVSFGLSYRSEINLSGNSTTKAYLDKIPARLMFGAAARKDGLRGGKDFIVYSAQLTHYFSSDRSSVFDRDPQTVFGVGAEYSYAWRNARIPLRIGYASVPGTGPGFGSRNTFNYGIGYRPLASNYAVDVAWGTPEKSGADFAITLSYRFGN
ncbi:MAG: hypothetical protein ACOYON_14505 [Fimbriimonas sp.]